MRNDGYPKDWEEIAYRIKEKASWVCERCGHKHSPTEGYMLTVHHLNSVKSDNREANLVALCQRCHLYLERKDLISLVNQYRMFDNLDLNWLKPHLEGMGIAIPEARLKNL